jgi:hypothetical protein
MNIDTLQDLIHAVEADDTLVARQYLLDGDEDDFPASLKALVEYFDSTLIGRKEAAELVRHGFGIHYGDCICIHTKKGLANTGSDNL